jgi:FAD/FMN-containing dehydrogenase
MPRSIQEILDHADELAQRFESYEPDEADERSVEEYMLERAALARARSERQVADAVIAARAAGASWQKIGSLLGTSAQAAQQRYGALIDVVG